LGKINCGVWLYACFYLVFILLAWRWLPGLPGLALAGLALACRACRAWRWLAGWLAGLGAGWLAGLAGLGNKLRVMRAARLAYFATFVNSFAPNLQNKCVQNY